MATPVTTEIRNWIGAAIEALTPEVRPNLPFVWIRESKAQTEDALTNSTRFFFLEWDGTVEIADNTGGFQAGEFRRGLHIYIYYRGAGGDVDWIEEATASDHDRISLMMQQPAILQDWTDGSLVGVFPGSEGFVQYSADETKALMQLQYTIEYSKGA